MVFVCKIFGPDGPGRFIYPSRWVEYVAPFIFRGLGLIGAIWTPEIDGFRSDGWGIGPTNFELTHVLFALNALTVVPAVGPS